ncbi:unnamed protein product [Rotaria magnacalcarata]|uniref:Protein kinase domain-containing protein n=2 Tax=Rotaria magnacalcarata TaxID=392030 RepID=A0A816RMK0_9BILA|nr:unnamed protein product [Rotaria magnacalcarata]CAF2075204.1 unnamed protein product [Rotaria magnacalcarata]CAF2146662.1 unnamed protein product [Rotaria magnacalcarata]CAF3838807.1 unnamed protein product [Rotaria magnacalcarata]CAF4044994.1 unnamed protein product [Rotaria magnacalcarata]
MRVAYAFRPFPANYKPSCDATLPAAPTPYYPLRTSSSIPAIQTQQRQLTSLYVNGVPYIVIRLIGEGLHSRVYAAYDPRTNQSVAIKVVKNVDPADSHEHSKMFFKEIRYLTKLQTRNPYVIRVYNHEYDSKTQTGKIVMESGHDFRFMLPLQASPKEKQMTIAHAKFYWSQMVDAVAKLHRNGIVHSDIKPENFIMTPEGQIRVIDLGLSFRMSHTQSSILRPFAGTPEYMPPEVCQIENGHYSRQGRASDIWALGVLLFEMIFGYRPFEHIHDNFDKMTHIARLTDTPIIPPINNPHVRDIIQQCLQINPARRPTAQQILQHPFFTF